MATRVRVGLGDPQPRRFGLTVGSAFLVLSLLGAWRGFSIAPIVFAALAAGLLLAAIVFPRKLCSVERAWMALAHAMSRLTTPIVMAVLYFGVITPVALLRRALGHNPIAHAEGESGFWKVRPVGGRRSNLKRQF